MISYLIDSLIDHLKHMYFVARIRCFCIMFTLFHGGLYDIQRSKGRRHLLLTIRVWLGIIHQSQVPLW